MFSLLLKELIFEFYCSLSSVLFNLYSNDLIQGITDLNVGIENDGQKIGILAYADDVVLLAETESDLQVLLDELSLWCINNKMEINKSKIVHFRNPSISVLAWFIHVVESFLKQQTSTCVWDYC